MVERKVKDELTNMIQTDVTVVKLNGCDKLLPQKRIEISAYNVSTQGI